MFLAVLCSNDFTQADERYEIVMLSFKIKTTQCDTAQINLNLPRYNSCYKASLTKTMRIRLSPLAL